MAKTVEGSGALDSKLWIIGEAPGQQEEEQGIPFVGASGKLLRQTLRRAGVSEDTVRFENLIGERPPRNNFSYFENSEGRKAILATSVKQLKDRIRDCKPNLVLCLGANPLKYIMGQRGISNWRGHTLWSEELGCKILCSYHPSACLRQRYADKKQHPGQYDALLYNDITKAS